MEEERFMKKVTFISLLFVAALFVSCGGGGGGGNDLQVQNNNQPSNNNNSNTDTDSTSTSDINPADYIVPNKVEAIKVE